MSALEPRQPSGHAVETQAAGGEAGDLAIITAPELEGRRVAERGERVCSGRYELNVYRNVAAVNSMLVRCRAPW